MDAISGGVYPAVAWSNFDAYSTNNYMPGQCVAIASADELGSCGWIIKLP
jgi:hypothetical protein